MKEFTQISEAQPIVRKLLEADIQSACVTWARKRGYWARKFSSPANRSVPDYLFSRIGSEEGFLVDVPYDIKFFTEFKAPRKKATENQLEEQKLMRDAGWAGMQECDSVDGFKAWVIGYEEGSCLPQRI